MALKKVEFRGYVRVLAGQNARYPPDERLDLPWTGIFVHNLSENYIYMDIDAAASDKHSYPLFDYDWRNFDDIVVESYISFYAASATTVFVMGFSEWLKTNIVLEKAGDPAAPLAPRPLVQDEEFFNPPTPEQRPKVMLTEEDAYYEEYLKPGL